MSIIEQAAKRLEQLRQAGVDLQWQRPGGVSAPAARTPAVVPPAVGRPPVRETVAPAKAGLPVQPRHSIELDLARAATQSLLVPGSANAALAAEFRGIKRPLIANVVGEGEMSVERANLILVTSAVSGEGKTFCAINLALSIAAEVDKSVLLVDADVLKPSVAARLGIEPRLGLLDVLSGPRVDLGEVILRTNVPKFDLLLSGAPRSNSAELLAGGEMKRLFDELAQQQSDRIIVIDGPPLLPTTEAKTLAERVGQVVMVVGAETTPQSAVTKAYAAVENCDVVMSILNRRSDMLRSIGQGYGYGFGGYGYGHES